MKRIIIAALMLAFAVAVSFTSGILTNKSFTDLSVTLEDFSEQIDTMSDEEINRELENIYAKWNKASMYLHLFINSDIISDIERDINAMRFYASDDRLLLNESCTSAMTAIKGINELEKVSFKNIF